MCLFFLPCSRLSLRALSANSISPSPNQRILAADSPRSHEESTLVNTQQAPQGLGGLPAFHALNPPQQSLVSNKGLGVARPGEGPAGPYRRPPLPPSPQASRPQGSAGSLNPLASAWINPGDGSGSGSAGRQRFLSGSAGSYSEPSLSGVGASSSGSGQRQFLQPPQQQQQQQVLPAQYAYGSSLGSEGSFSPGGEGLLAAAVSHEDVAAAAGNPYHPQHESAMQLLLEHQQQQLQQLQQQRTQQVAAAASSSSSGGRVPQHYQRSSSFGTVGVSPRSPRMSPRAPSRSGSFNR